MSLLNGFGKPQLPRIRKDFLSRRLTQIFIAAAMTTKTSDDAREDDDDKSHEADTKTFASRRNVT